ncbi:DNA polymerase I [Proteiniclasticum sp. C24MP]|uniref:DNA polymerase I n=1 Tax=Proteiniclasticum sp. C24MP TaxID=3374101 RepID=UPI003754DEEC
MSRLLIIDGNSIMNRAFYANPKFITSKGMHTGAIYGFINMMMKIKGDLSPDYIVCAFDRKAPTFRHLEYDDYKAGRKKMPEELAMQFPVMKEVLQHMAVDILEIDGFEADDVIGTLSLKAEKEGDEVYVLSGDKDTLQLASDKTKVVITKKGVSVVDVYDREKFIEEYGITPTQFIDVKGLMGDASDNIKGVPGIGEKTAFKLIKEYGSIENTIENAENITMKKVRENLIAHAEDAIFSKKLATIIRDVQVEMDMDRLRSSDAYDVNELRRLFSELEFRTLLAKLSDAPAEDAPKKEAEKVDFTEVEHPEDLEEALLTLKKEVGLDQPVAIYFDVHHAPKLSEREMNWMVLSSKEKHLYIHTRNIFASEKALDVLKRFLEDEHLPKISYDIKDGLTIFKRLGMEPKNISFDVNLAAYLLEPTDGKLTLKDLTLKNLPEAAVPEGKDGEVYLASKLFELYEKFAREMEETELNELYYEVELPLTRILSDMEIEGFNVNEDLLDEMTVTFKEDIDQLEKEIYDLAGEAFNINSPKQLGTILFERLDLPVIKKTKTGYSTNIDVLEALKDKHPIIEKVMQFRTVTKIYSTYIVGLKSAIDGDGRIHSTFNQTLATTGRLSSTDPNLQNIPIRHEMGRAVRKVFIPHDEDSILLSCDYSQIELRVLAHISGDEKMIEAYNGDIDIHTKTASEVFGVPFEEVSYALRSSAKAVNFGIIYGMSDFSLSQDLGISRKEAKEYMEIYFSRYPKVKEYLDNIVLEAKEKGFVRTIMNRRRYIPEISQRNKIVQAAGVRLAMNSPIQGSAADIMKMAMVKVYEALKEKKLRSSLILQVHDELILNTRKDELEIVKKLVKEEMENAVKLKVKLQAEESVGETWFEA